MPHRSKPGVNWDEIRQRYEAGESANGIANSGVGVSKQAILGRIKRHGWVQEKRSPAVAARQQKAIAESATLATNPKTPILMQEWWGKDTPATRSFILDRLIAGAPLKLAAQYAGIHEKTLTYWRNRDPSFAEQCEAARAGHAIEHIEVIDYAGREVKDWKASAHLLSKNPLTKAEFGDTAKAGGPVINVVLNVACASTNAALDLTDTVTIEHD